MRHPMFLLALLAMCFGLNNAIAEVLVSNVHAWQLDAPSKIVEITYDVEADAETVAIYLEMSMDGGESWDVPVWTVEGDIGFEVEPGQNKQILWDAGTDFPNQISDQMQARVTADDSVAGGWSAAGGLSRSDVAGRRLRVGHVFCEDDRREVSSYAEDYDGEVSLP